MRRTYRVVERRVVFEIAADEPHEYASTHAVPPEDIAALVTKVQSAIDTEDLHDDGFGPPPHVTILYGLGDEDKDTALEILRNAGPCKAKVKGIELFKNDEYDVVILALDSEDLARLRDDIDKAVPDNMNEWSEYKPHITIAYVLPGKGEAYKDMESELVGREFDLDALEFSGTDDEVERIDLKPATKQLPEESPLFGTDILAGEDPGTEDAVRKALHPIINRSNRRIVSVADDDSGVNVLLDNGQNLVLNRGPDTGPLESWLVTHNGEQFDTADLAALEELVKRLSSPTMEQEDPDEFEWKDYDAPPEPPADADAPMEQPEPKRKRERPVPRAPQSNVVTLSNDRYKVIVTVDQPIGEARGRRFDRVEKVINQLNADPMVKELVTPRRASVSSIVMDIHDRSPRQFGVAVNSIEHVLKRNRFEVRNRTKVPKLTKWQWVRGGRGYMGKASEVMSEDTYTSDVGFTDTIPITKVRRRKVNLPGLTKAGKRRRVRRRFRVRESMSKDVSPILIVLRPQQVEALSAKPVWSALHESGVITTKSFKMGTEDFFEVSIDTLRKEWSQANAGVLLDEVGSIDPRIQRKIMERVDVDTMVGVVCDRLPTWCGNVPVDVALKESESFANTHRSLRLQGKEIDEAWIELELARDVGVVSRVLEWYDLSRDVLERLAAIDAKEDGAKVIRKAATKLLEQETTDPAAGIGVGGSGMPTANTAGATIQGYSEQEPEGVSVSSRNWPAQGMFKIHVLVGETPQWVYRQVVGHEGEGEQSMIVYRTPEGRVMRMPHEQIDAAAGFGAVVTPEELTGTEPAGTEPAEQPLPTFQQSPEPQVEPMSVGEQIDPNQDKLTRDTSFAKSFAKYQQSKDDRDWDEVRKHAERVTGLKGPELDAALAPMSAEKENRQPMYGGAQEQIVPPPGVDECNIPPQFRSKFDNKKAKDARAKKKKDDEASDKRQAEAVRMFSGDDRFQEMMNKFEATRNEGYLIRASERASRVAGIPVMEARTLVDEILEAAKRGV